MKITKTEEHGVRVMMAIARENRQFTISELAEKEGLTEALIAKLLGMLRRGGVVKAQRGRKGGYELSRPPEEININMMLAALGTIYSRGCTASEDPAKKCPHLDKCGIQAVWEHLEAHADRIFRQVTLADLVKGRESMQGMLEEITRD